MHSFVMPADPVKTVFGFMPHQFPFPVPIEIPSGISCPKCGFIVFTAQALLDHHEMHHVPNHRAPKVMRMPHMVAERNERYRKTIVFNSLEIGDRVRIVHYAKVSPRCSSVILLSTILFPSKATGALRASDQALRARLRPSSPILCTPTRGAKCALVFCELNTCSPHVVVLQLESGEMIKLRSHNFVPHEAKRFCAEDFARIVAHRRPEVCPMFGPG